MYILGISAFYHDSAAALIKDGELIAASMEERFSRKKHDNSFPQLAVEFCLDFAGITADDLEYVVFYEIPSCNSIHQQYISKLKLYEIIFFPFWLNGE